jgi:hypothetical protein
MKKITKEDVAIVYNQGKLSDDEVDKFLLEIENQEFKYGEQREKTDDDWYYQKQEREENDWNCADADVEDVDFSEIEV